MKTLFITAIAFLSFLTTSCMENKSKNNKSELEAIFPKGELGPAENFTGNAWNHQIKGQPRQTIKKGDVIQCPPNVLHWHGASPDTGLLQMYILPKTEKGIVQWLQPVTDEEYNSTIKK